MNPEEIIQHISNQIPHSSEGIEMVGAPLGNNVFCETCWEKSLVKKLQESIPLICTWSTLNERSVYSDYALQQQQIISVA